MHLSLFATFAVLFGAHYVAANTCLTSHNALRQLHIGTADLEWDAGLAKAAEDWAKYLVGLGYMKHSYVAGQGENIYYAKSKFAAPCVDASLAWYSEIKDYNYNSPGFSGATGHFTQLVWKDSKKVGVGIATSAPDSSGLITTYIVAKYTPQGNFYYRGQQAQFFRNNVAAQKTDAKVPSRYELDLSLCKDNSGEATCTSYLNFGFCTKYKSFIGSYCAKTCNLCH